MHNNRQFIDFRVYRPASVLVVDLVKHSKRGKAEIQSIQKTMEEVFRKGVEALEADGVYFNYTGDGYVCTFAGDSSARILDFINAAIPELRRRLSAYDQELRAGMDFGLIHLSKNPLTGTLEHFNVPGIQASRLESSAPPGQILCTETVRRIFVQHYPTMFSTAAINISTKDREIRAYEVFPIDFTKIREVLSEFMFRKGAKAKIAEGKRDKILLVDDEEVILDVGVEILEKLFPEYEIITASDGQEALECFRPGEFVFVLTDRIMPRMDGLKLTEELLLKDQDQAVILFSGYSLDAIADKFLGLGGSYCMQKPFRIKELYTAIQCALSRSSAKAVRDTVDMLCDDTGVLLWLMQEVADSLNSLLEQAANSDDLTYILLRHKAKQLVLDFIDTIQPGKNITASTSILKTQLRCVARLFNVIGRVKVGELQAYLATFVEDLRKLYPKVEILLSFEIDHENAATLRFGTIATLVVCELIDNAITATKQSGKIRITCSLLRSVGMLHIIAQDNGPGVPENLIETMFDEGVSSKGIGRGLGLSLVREAVRSLKGDISYEYNNGALFRVVIPVDQ